MVDRKLAERCVALLQEMIDLDAAAVTALCAARVPCNEALAAHPTVQVGGEVGAAEVGLLGVLNGLCGAYEEGERAGWGAVSVVIDSFGNAIGAHLLASEDEPLPDDSGV